MTRPSLLRSMLSFSAMTFISRVLGLLREIVIAYAFGANAATDAFWVAFRIPNFLRRLFAEGSFSLAFVPVFTQVKEKRSHAELKALVARVAGTLGGVLLVVSAIGVLGSDVLTTAFSPGALETPDKFRLTSELLRVTFPFLLFVSLTALAGGVLNSFHNFALPAITPVILNLCMIAAALWLAPRLDVPIMALGWSILVAGILQLLLQFPALARLDLLAWPRWGWQHPDVQRILRLMLPTLFGSSIAQINLLLDTLIASFLIAGSQTWLAQTDRLLEFPLGVFGVALGTVILPSLSRHHVITDREGFSKALDWGLRTALLISVPAMLGLVLLAKPMLATLLQHGRFTPHDVDMAALSLCALSTGLPAFALVKVVAPAFYARQDTRTPVRAGVAAMIANMVLNILFVAALFALWRQPNDLADGWLAGIARVPGLHMALALASSLASYLNLWLLWRALKRDGIYARQPGWRAHWMRLLVACAGLVVVLVAGMVLWSDWDSLADRNARAAVDVADWRGQPCVRGHAHRQRLPAARPAGSLTCAIVRDREDQKAAVLGRTSQYIAQRSRYNSPDESGFPGCRRAMSGAARQCGLHRRVRRRAPRSSSRIDASARARRGARIDAGRDQLRTDTARVLFARPAAAAPERRARQARRIVCSGHRGRAVAAVRCAARGDGGYGFRRWRAGGAVGHARDLDWRGISLRPCARRRRGFVAQQRRACGIRGRDHAAIRSRRRARVELAHPHAARRRSA